jgi:hypothetical protein
MPDGLPTPRTTLQAAKKALGGAMPIRPDDRRLHHGLRQNALA